MAYNFTTVSSTNTTQTWYNSEYSALGPISIFVTFETSLTPSCSPLPVTVAATAATPVTATAPPSSSGSSGFNCTFCGSSNQTNGAHITSPVAAGIGIGSAVVGAMIAALIFFFFILPSRKSSSESYQQQDFALDERGSAGNEKFDVSTTVTNIKHFVPQPTEDDAMTRDLTTIFVAIKDHIQNYYHITQDQRQMVDEERLNELSRATAIPSRDIVGLLHNSRTGIPTLRLFLACYILSRCTEQSDEAQSFLPDEVLAFKGLNFTGQPSTANQVTLLSKWKTISGTLLARKYSEPPTGNDKRLARIEKALDASEAILRPFLNRGIEMDTETRRHNLREVMKLAAQYAFSMFSQPCSYRFDNTRVGQPDTMVVFPALLITVNHEGQELSPPKVLREEEVVSVGRY